jgi:hypothetical protein
VAIAITQAKFQQFLVKMSGDEGVGYISPITYQCLFRPAFDNIRAAHSNSAEAVEAINVSGCQFEIDNYGHFSPFNKPSSKLIKTRLLSSLI